jgi:hypothetical protein
VLQGGRTDQRCSQTREIFGSDGIALANGAVKLKGLVKPQSVACQPRKLINPLVNLLTGFRCSEGLPEIVYCRKPVLLHGITWDFHFVFVNG